MWVPWMWMDSRYTVHMCGNGDHHVGAMDVDGQQVYSTQHVTVMQTIMWVPWDVDGQQVYSTHVR